jgi:hypothetical protein
MGKGGPRMSNDHAVRVSLGEMLKLVEDGILVRNIEHDEDFGSYITQSNRLIVVLKNAQKAMETQP